MILDIFKDNTIKQEVYSRQRIVADAYHFWDYNKNKISDGLMDMKHDDFDWRECQKVCWNFDRKEYNITRFMGVVANYFKVNPQEIEEYKIKYEKLRIIHNR